MVFPEPSKGKVGNKRFGKSSPKEKEKVKAAQEIPVYEEENTEPEDFSVVEEPEEIFSEEQLIKIREKGLDLDALTDSQKRAMAKMMAEDANRYKKELHMLAHTDKSGRIKRHCTEKNLRINLIMLIRQNLCT